MTLAFPPAMYGEAVPGDPAETAALRATQGVDAGLVCHRVTADRVAAAIVLTPEVPLAQAMAMLPVCGVGLQNALGALAPPEVGVHLDWTGAIRVNGARCGRLRVLSSDADPAREPQWLVVAWELALLPLDAETGNDPERTALFVEGCADVDPEQLVEAWARHTLLWITRWESDPRALHAEWRGLVHGLGEDVALAGHSGTFLGVDEDFGMLIRDGEQTHLVPLTFLLEDTA